MKFSTVLAIVFCAVAVSAAPHHGGDSNKEKNVNVEDNSNHKNKEINQSIGSVGSTNNGGLLGGLLAGGVLSETTNTNNVNQNANIN